MDEKRKIERLAAKTGITVSELLRQRALGKNKQERSGDWYDTVSVLESICSAATGQTREQLLGLIGTLYRGGDASWR